MSEVALVIEGLSKQYRLGPRESGYRTLRESLVDGALGLFRRGAGNGRDERFWALKDVSFEVQTGQVVGIIGRNGAGKTTLLRILSRITEPTAGRATVNGRVASLLEVGTGFHPELTGRDNVFLNGAILGMSRAEIRRKFDEIVAFAEVEKFVDTPVKRYSSGMQTRLAFAVAAHLEPEILIVDEVLAVGDVAFQAKCIGKMESVARQGRTVLFVSHNMAAVLNLCDSSVVLDHGQVAFRGSAADGVNAYVRSLADRSADGDLSRLPRHGAGGVRLNELRLRRGKELITRHICGDPLEIALRYQVAEELVVSDLSLQVRLQDENGATVLTLWNKSVERDRPEYPRGGWASFLIQRLPLRPGVYKLSMWVKSHRGIEDWLDHTLDFEVIDGDFFGTGRMPPKDTGPVLVDHVFRVLPELDVL